MEPVTELAVYVDLKTYRREIAQNISVPTHIEEVVKEVLIYGCRVLLEQLDKESASGGVVGG